MFKRFEIKGHLPGGRIIRSTISDPKGISDAEMMDKFTKANIAFSRASVLAIPME